MSRRWFEMSSLAGGVAAALASVAASLCCVGPLALTLLGVNGMILAAAIKPYRPYLLAASLALLALAVWATRRQEQAAQDAAACPSGSRRGARIVLWTAAALWVGAVLVGFAANRYWL